MYDLFRKNIIKGIIKEELMRQYRNFKGTLNLVCFIVTGLLFSTITGCSVARYDIPESNMYPDSQRIQAKKYFMKQKIWTVGEKFIIKDEYRNPVFFVKGKAFSIGNKLKFFDLKGNELAYIKQKVLSFKNLYKIYRNRELYAKIVKKITLFKDKFIVDIPGPDDYTVSGDFTDYRYSFTRNGREVAVISKKWPSWSDYYRIEILPGEDDLIILAAAVVIDMVSHNNDNYHHH